MFSTSAAPTPLWHTAAAASPTPSSTAGIAPPPPLPSGTVAVPVIYVCSSDATGLQVLAHFYRVLVPDLKDALLAAMQQQQETVPGSVADPPEVTRKALASSAARVLEDGASPIVYVVPQRQQNGGAGFRAGASSAANGRDGAAGSLADSSAAAAAAAAGGGGGSSDARRSARELLLATIEFARVQFLIMSSADAQQLLDEAGCVPPKFWDSVALSAMVASADFPVASAVATSAVGRVFFDTASAQQYIMMGATGAGAAGGSASAASRPAVMASLTRARRVIHLMNDDVVPSESTAASRQLRAFTATLWYQLCVRATAEALEFVRPVISGNAAVRAAHSSRLVHIRRFKRLRESLFTVDATAGALFQSELTESRTLTSAATSIKQQLYRTVGQVTDLVGSAMRHDVDWSSVERPPYGRELRRVHFRPFNPPATPPPGTAPRHAQPQAVEPVFLWSKALTPIQVRLSRQGWERLVQGDPVMWRFKSLPVRLKETTTKLSKLFSCSTGELMITESTQIARATVLRSLPWTPGDVLLLMDGLVPGVYTALASLLKEQHGVIIHTLSMSEPLPTRPAAEQQQQQQQQQQRRRQQQARRGGMMGEDDEDDEANVESNGAAASASSMMDGDDPIVAAVAKAIDLVKPLVIVIPHITRTGLVLPVERLIPVCRSRRVVVLVDGTDVINNVATQVGHYGADFYIAPLDTHLFCPAGLTAVIVSKTRKEAVSTLVHSYFFGQGFEEEWTYTGLTDQSRMISIIQALQFNKNVCPGQAQYTRQLAAQAHDLLTKFWNVEPIYRTDEFQSAVISVLLPLAGARHDADARFLQAMLVRRGIHVDILSVRFRGNNHKLVVRLQFYPYNDLLEVKRLAIELLDAIKEIS